MNQVKLDISIAGMFGKNGKIIQRIDTVSNNFLNSVLSIAFINEFKNGLIK